MDSERFTGIFTRLQSRLRDRARQLLKNDDDAADALQEAFCSLWQRRDSIADERAAEGLSVVSVRNECLDALRRRDVRRGVDAGEIEIPVEDDAGGDALFDEVRQLIDATLSERDRRILFLRDYSGWEFADIAADTGLTEANVRVVLSRARRAVRQAYISHSNS